MVPGQMAGGAVGAERASCRVSRRFRDVVRA